MKPPSPLVIAAVLAGLGGLAGCRSDGRQLRPPEQPLPATTTVAPSTVPGGGVVATITTPAAPLQLFTPWPNGGPIPIRATCDDADLAPALTWNNVPAGTVELAITVTDLDADFTHWAVGAIDPSLTGIAEGQLPSGAIQWNTDFGRSGYGGPCPPPGDDAHHYLFTLHALNQQLELADDASADEVISLLNQIAIAQSSVSGTYARAE
jgi:Raf kinase inhibitor-like YbhB/YbcL family protein